MTKRYSGSDPVHADSAASPSTEVRTNTGQPGAATAAPPLPNAESCASTAPLFRLSAARASSRAGTSALASKSTATILSP